MFTAGIARARDPKAYDETIVVASVVAERPVLNTQVHYDGEIVTAEIVDEENGFLKNLAHCSREMCSKPDLGVGLKIAKGVSEVKAASNVAKSTVAAGAAVVSATGLTVAATSGAGIASGLAAAGGIVGGGMAAGPTVLAGGPAYLATRALNSTVFKKEDGLSPTESSARSAARVATKAGAAVGVAGTGAVVVAGGASGAAIMSTLATVGGVVGGGAIAGTAVLVAAPIAIAGAAGFGIYKLLGGGKKK